MFNLKLEFVRLIYMRGRPGTSRRREQTNELKTNNVPFLRFRHNEHGHTRIVMLVIFFFQHIKHVINADVFEQFPARRPLLFVFICALHVDSRVAAQNVWPTTTRATLITRIYEQIRPFYDA